MRSEEKLCVCASLCVCVCITVCVCVCVCMGVFFPSPSCRDTAGQERYQTITKQYYRRAQVKQTFPFAFNSFSWLFFSKATYQYLSPTHVPAKPFHSNNPNTAVFWVSRLTKVCSPFTSTGHLLGLWHHKREILPAHYEVGKWCGWGEIQG